MTGRPRRLARPARRAAWAAAATLGVLLALAAWSPLTALNALTRTDTYRLADGIAYGPLPRHKLDVFTPTAPAPSPAGWPVVVFFYGGSWNTGERGDYKFVGAALAERGILAIVADYRLYPEVRYPEFLRDAALALAWGLDHGKRLGGDPKRTFVMGHSAGGYNAAMLALDPRWLAATGHRAKDELAGWIGLAGPYEFLPLKPGPSRPVFFHPDYPPGTQPIDHVASDAPPAFLAAPANDTVVSPQRSTLAMAAKLEGVGVPVDVKMYDGLTHSLLVAALARPLRGLAPVLDDVVGFVDRTSPRR
jgi:acetyl esterase/lipase